jgi:hypothetical protein
MGVFYPSARVQLAMRLEEFDDTGALVSRLQAQDSEPETSAETASNPPIDSNDPNARAELEARLESLDANIAIVQENPDALVGSDSATFLARAQAQREQLLRQLGVGAASQSAGQGPPAVDGPPPDGRVVLGSIAPRSVQIERNGLRTADTCTVVINHSDAPFDPRLLRAAAIEVTLGIVDPADYARGVAGERRADGSLMSMVERSRTLSGPLSRTANTTRFVGWVDTWQLNFDSLDGDTITLECRDLSALFFDTPLTSGSGIDLTLPIDEGVRRFIDAYNETRGMLVAYGRPGQTDPGIAPTPAEAAPAQARTRRSGSRQRRTGDAQQNLWDHITEACARVGLVPVIYDYTLHICEPRTFYTSTDQPWRMVYGRNLSHLEFTRKLGGSKVPTIEVRCYQPDLGRTAWARWPNPEGAIRFGVFGINNPPATARRPNEPSVSGHAPTERIQTYLVTGVADGQTLLRVARNLFEQIGRQEIEGNLETADVTSVGSAAAADLLSLDNGDGVELLVSGGPENPDTTGMTAAQIQALSREARTEYLQSVGWGRAVAERFSQLQDATANQTIFRAQNVRLNYDVQEGFSAVVDFINFIEVRETAWATPQPGVPAATVSDDSGLPPDIAATISQAAQQLGQEVASAFRESGLLGDAVEGGSVSPDEYADRAAELDESVPEAVSRAETGGAPEGPPV